MSSMLRVLGGDNVTRALEALERIAAAMEQANIIEANRLAAERGVRRAKAVG